MSVSAACCSERFMHGLLEVSSLVDSIEPTPVVVERGSRKAGHAQEKDKRVLRLEVLDSSNFQRRSCDFKARNFPKYATSGRSRSFGTDARVGGI